MEESRGDNRNARRIRLCRLWRLSVSVDSFRCVSRPGCLVQLQEEAAEELVEYIINQLILVSIEYRHPDFTAMSTWKQIEELPKYTGNWIVTHQITLPN
jgi:hypothetical protein